MENRIRKFGDADKSIVGGPGSAGIWYDSETGVLKVNPGEPHTAVVETFTGTAKFKAVTDVAANGAITVSYTSPVQIVKLTKATAGAFTLAAPSTAQDGHQLVVTSTTAAAHVVTATDLIHDGVTGGAKDTATFAAYPGASITLLALGGFWYVVSKNAVTVAAA